MSNKRSWYLISMVAAVQQRALEDRRLTLKGECADGPGKFLFFSQGWSWLCVNGTDSGRRAPVQFSGLLSSKNSPVCPAGTLHFSHHEALALLHTGTALAGGPKWWADLFYFFLPGFYDFKTWSKKEKEKNKTKQTVFLLFEKKINCCGWTGMVCQWCQWKPNSRVERGGEIRSGQSFT